MCSNDMEFSLSELRNPSIMLAIFDMSSVNVIRYNSEILRSESHQFVAYVDDPDLCVPIDDANCVLVGTGWWTVSKFVSHFREHGISVIIVSGQRPADLRVLVAAGALKIPVVYKMHGLYVPYMKRGIRFYLSKLGKSVRTLFYLADVALVTRDLLISRGMFMSFIFGRCRKVWAGSDLLRVEVGLIWNEYWVVWHKEHWRMNPRNGWLIVGNPDTVKFNHFDVEVDGGSIVYIYQTLVEDGRINLKLMTEFYDGLQSAAKNTGKSVYVKWHPRGDCEIRDRLIARGFLICNDMPKGDMYVGHYSSLLGLVPVIGGHIIIFELDGHVTPEAISKIASKVVFNVNDFKKVVEGFDASWPSKKSEAIHYFGDHFDESVEKEAISKFINIR
jgi:hypothetical protein